MDENLLVISLDKEEKRDDEENYLTREFAFNKFKRSFRLSDKLDKEDISAKYKNGILLNEKNEVGGQLLRFFPDIYRHARGQE